MAHRAEPFLALLRRAVPHGANAPDCTLTDTTPCIRRPYQATPRHAPRCRAPPSRSLLCLAQPHRAESCGANAPSSAPQDAARCNRGPNPTGPSNSAPRLAKSSLAEPKRCDASKRSELRPRSKPQDPALRFLERLDAEPTVAWPPIAQADQRPCVFYPTLDRHCVRHVLHDVQRELR